MRKQALRLLRPRGAAACRPASLTTARRGSGLIDGLVALAILAFGMLAMTRFQGRMVAQTTEAQSRQVATQLTSELLSTVLVDTANAACYTLPQSGSCANSGAISRASAWQTRVEQALPGTVSSTATLDAGTGRMTVVVSWTGKDSTDARRLETVTDVR
ncbi:MAG: pilus assembly protein PilV [Betaproteobacteria bacterium]|nr:pilus assembly protein PilV [Betaproteobacteria bacterium]MCC6249295.1 pilus assembly protein PilV [Rubrivivax sp.]MCL4699747.1 pilus assembly protein PilV [Burkholderiaceae bacterium]